MQPGCGGMRVMMPLYLECNIYIPHHAYLRVEGSFEAGDVVGIYDMQECEIARGKVRYNAQEIGQILGLESSKIAKVLGHKFGDEVIHRDDIALL